MSETAFRACMAFCGIVLFGCYVYMGVLAYRLLVRLRKRKRAQSLLKNMKGATENGQVRSL